MTMKEPNSVTFHGSQLIPSAHYNVYRRMSRYHQHPHLQSKASFWSTSLSASLSSLNNQGLHYGDHHIINIRLILNDITKVMLDLRQQQRKAAKIWRALSTIVSSSPTRGSLSSTLGLLCWSSSWHIDSKSTEEASPYIPGQRRFRYV